MTASRTCLSIAARSLKSGHDAIKQLKTIKFIPSCVPIISLVFTTFFVAELKAMTVDQTGSDLSSAMVWTGKPMLDKAPENMVAFRKQFEMTTMPQQVTLQIFADVRYMLWVNGRYVERGPARFEPAAPEYDSVDITKFMRAGSNVISILVTAQISNGKTRLHEPCLTAELVDQNDRKLKIICDTDATWKWSDQTRYRRAISDWANIYDVVDARVEDGDWTLLDYDDSKWAGVEPVKDKTWGALTARRIPLLRETVVVPEWQAGLQWPVTLKDERTNHVQISAPGSGLCAN